MAKVAKKSFLIGVAPNQYTMVLPDEYSTVGEFLGVSELTSAPPAGTDRISLSYGLSTGKIFHIKISYKVDNKRKTAKLVCDRNHIGSGLGVVGKTFRGQTILGAVIPQHLTFG